MCAELILYIERESRSMGNTKCSSCQFLGKKVIADVSYDLYLCVDRVWAAFSGTEFNMLDCTVKKAKALLFGRIGNWTDQVIKEAIILAQPFLPPLPPALSSGK